MTINNEMDMFNGIMGSYNEEDLMDRFLEEDDGQKEMELHRFYLYDKTKENNPMVPFLYAYTRDPDISNTFKATRNPDIFIYKHSKEPIGMIADIEHKHPGIRLRKTKLKSRSKNDPTSTIDVPIVLTCEEERRVIGVHDDLFNIVNVKTCMEDMTMLSTGLNRALYSLGYFDIYRYMSQMQYIDSELGYFYEGIGRNLGMEPGPLPNIIPDEFSIFMLMFGNTLK